MATSNQSKCEGIMELITTPFIILCALVSIAFFIGMKVGEDNEKVKHMKDKVQDWKPYD